MKNNFTPQFFGVFPSKKNNPDLSENINDEFLKSSTEGSVGSGDEPNQAIFFVKELPSLINKNNALPIYFKPSKPKGVAVFKTLITVILFCFSCFSAVYAQTLPSPTSCTSKDLSLVSATLPPNAGEGPCSCSGTRTLMLTINNKTGSTRTSFAYWGTLERYDASGNLISSTPINGCNGPIPASATTVLPFNQILNQCNQSLKIKNLFLAWTTANDKETCSVLTANPNLISPKCGTLPEIQILAGVDADFAVTGATCTIPGSIVTSPFGGKPGYTYSWSASNDGVIPVGQATSKDLTGLVAGTYTVTIKDSNGCTASRSRTVGAAGAVTVNAGNDFTKTCTQNASGKQIGEDAATGYTYLWVPATGLNFTNISNPIANPDVMTTYTVTKTNISTGCSNTDTVTVIVDKTLPATNAGSDVTVNCSTPSMTLTATGGASYLWSPSGATTASITVTPSATSTFTVTATGVNGCTKTDDVVVTVDSALPAANAGSDVTVNCTTPSTTLTASGGVSYLWSPGGATTASTTVTPSATTTYTVTVTGANGCTKTDDVMVTLDKALPAANAGSDVTVNCSAPSTTLTASGGVSYLWSPGGAATASITVTPSATTTYTVTVTGANGCTKTDDVVVTLDKALPAANAGSDVTVNCTAPSATLTASGGVSYLWSPGGAATASVTVIPSATTTYTVTVTGANGCTKTDDVVVTLDGALPAANAGSDVTVNCTTPGTTLTASGGASYQWSPGGATTASITVTPSATTTYTVTVTGANGCTKTDDVLVMVNKVLPAANAGSDVTVTCTAPSTTLTASGGVSYLWSPGGAATASVTVTPSATTTYTVTVTGANGCTKTDDVIVMVNKSNPNPPMICAVQPSLCGPSTGSITILEPTGQDFEYSINNGGTWQSGAVFNGLAAGSVTGIKVRNKTTGCISDSSNCDNSACPTSPTARTSNTDAKDTPNGKVLENQVRNVGFDAYPVPFKDQLIIRYNFDYSSNVKIEVFNLLGDTILSKEDRDGYAGKEYALNLSTKIGDGQMYFVKVTTNQGSKVKKIISSR